MALSMSRTVLSGGLPLWSRKHSELEQVTGQHVLYETLFRLALDRYRQANHGRPPNRFIRQSSPAL